MSKNSTEILLKRTAEDASFIKVTGDTLGSQPIEFGEPIFIDNNDPRDETSDCDAYLAIGSNLSDSASKILKNAIFFKGFWNKDTTDNLVFHNATNTGLVKEDGSTSVYADRVTSSSISLSTEDETKYHIMCQANVERGSTDVNNLHGKFKKFDMNDAGIYVTANGVMHGAAWNDYAEKRLVREKEDTIPGTVVCEVGNGSLKPSEEKFQPCAYVVSDTYGFVIGEEDETPVAVAGRVLVRCSDSVNLGDCLCAGPNGEAVKMSRQEIVNYPDRILGVVTEIPSYEKWNGIEVNNRIWIKIK